MSTTGNWDTLIDFFASGVAASADATRETIESLLTWSEEAVHRGRAASVGMAQRLVPELIGTPILSAPGVARTHGVTPQGAILALRRLEELGLVTRLGEGTRRVRFAAMDVMQILQR